MRMYHPRIIDFITACQGTVRPESSVADALTKMKELKVDYLPVVDGRHVIGIFKSNVARTATRLKTSHQYHVSDFMIPGPRVVPPDANLYEVLDENAECDAGYTVVQDASGQVQGMLTPQNAINAYANLSQQRKVSLFRTGTSDVSTDARRSGQTG